MANLTVDAGDIVRLATSVAFKIANGTPTDPTTVRVRIRPPWPSDEIVYVYGTDSEVVHDGAGLFHADIEPGALVDTPAGTWRYRIEGEGAVTGAEDGVFDVRYSRFSVIA